MDNKQLAEVIAYGIKSQSENDTIVQNLAGTLENTVTSLMVLTPQNTLDSLKSMIADIEKSMKENLAANEKSLNALRSDIEKKIATRDEGQA